MTRLSCAVPHCKHTTGLRKGETKLPSEWICGEHWRMVPKRLKVRLSRARRWYKKRFGDNGYWTYRPGSDQRKAAIRYSHHLKICWEKCREAAIEAGMGIR